MNFVEKLKKGQWTDITLETYAEKNAKIGPNAKGFSMSLKILVPMGKKPLKDIKVFAKALLIHNEGAGPHFHFLFKNKEGWQYITNNKDRHWNVNSKIPDSFFNPLWEPPPKMPTEVVTIAGKNHIDVREANNLDLPIYEPIYP